MKRAVDTGCKWIRLLYRLKKMRSLELHRVVRVWRSLRVFVTLYVGVTRGWVYSPEPERKIRAQARQIEELKARLSERDQREALWEGAKDLAAWKAGVPSEIEWWEHWLAAAKSQTELEYWKDYEERLNPEQPLQEFVIEHLDASPASTVSILDVGAGPLTILGKRWDGHEVHITAVDPLADKYEPLVAELGTTPPVRTRTGEVERLTEYFPADCFDLVYMQNALDHSYDPLLGIRQMLRVVKPGCCVLLRHFVDEGEHGGYGGFHQWNLRAQNGRFVIWNRETHLCVNDILNDEAKITVEEITSEPDEDRLWFSVCLRKKTNSEI